MGFPDTVKQARRTLGISQEELAHALNISHVAINRRESDPAAEDESRRYILHLKTAVASKLLGTKYECLHLTEAKKRRGSCSANGSLRFSWKPVMCPLSVIDYVAVHELAHIAYKNHNSVFWARVKTVLPNYMEARNWLNLNRKLREME